MADSPVRRRLVVLMIVRLIISTILLGSAVLIQLDSSSGFPLGSLYALVGVTFGLSAVYAATLPLAERWRWLIDAQLAGDALVVTAFIWITGGVVSYFSSLYVLPIIAASTLQLRRGAVMLSVFSTLLYTTMVLVQFTSLPGASPGVVLPSPQVAQYTVAINALGFLAVGLLSGSLSESVRRAGVELADASTEIENLQAFNQHIVDSLTMGIVTADRDGRVLTFNRVAEAITGRPVASAVGENVIDVLHLPPEFAVDLDGRARDPMNRRADYRYRTPDDRQIDIGLSATHLVTSAGPEGLLFTFQDVTAFKKLERDARMQQRLAAVGEMAAGIAHEIRNPLASMSGSIQVLRKDLTLTAEQAQLMDIVLRESERLNQTIRSFLAYARPQRFGIARLDVRAVINDAAMLLRNSSEIHAAHVVEVDLPPDPVWCEADEGQIRQIIWNLATNGLRAMPDGGCLRLAARPDTGGRAGVVLTVQDDGVGIPEEELDAIFQPFRGAFAKGSGLGMAIVHRIVSDYNGEIRVTSGPGSGTAVEVLLPVQPQAAATS